MEPNDNTVEFTIDWPALDAATSLVNRVRQVARTDASRVLSVISGIVSHEDADTALVTQLPQPVMVDLIRSGRLAEIPPLAYEIAEAPPLVRNLVLQQLVVLYRDYQGRQG